MFLLATLVATLVLASSNAIEEELPTRSFMFTVILAAGISHVPGMVLAIAIARCQKPSLRIIVLLVPAYIVAVTGALAYLFYALNGKADSLNAAHLHVIFFPVFHCFFAAVLYSIAGIVAFVGMSR